jgi:hypothetical protein
MMRYARYAASLVFALLAAGFVALWVRNYRQCDVLQYVGPGDRGLKVASCLNSVCFILTNAQGWTGERGMSFHTFPAKPVGRLPGGSIIGLVNLPYWLLAASSLGLAALFAFKRTWRFSLRTILVATTLLAGLLSLAVYVI